MTYARYRTMKGSSSFHFQMATTQNLIGSIRWNKVGLITLACREAHSRKQRYQYCWFCWVTRENQRFSSILPHRHMETTSAENLSPFRKSRGRQVWTAEQSGQRKRFIQSASMNPSKYLVTNPWPHNLTPSQRGHIEGFGQQYPLPRSCKSFTSTEKCSINNPVFQRVTEAGGQTKKYSVALFPFIQIIAHDSTSHTKHYDKKTPLLDILSRRVTLGDNPLFLISSNTACIVSDNAKLGIPYDDSIDFARL